MIRERLETKGDRVTDLHLWQVGPGHRAAVISLISDNPLPPRTYKRRLGGLHGLSHVTIEVETCPHRLASALDHQDTHPRPEQHQHDLAERRLVEAAEQL